MIALIALMACGPARGDDIEWALHRDTAGVVRIDLRRVDLPGLTKGWFGSGSTDPALKAAATELGERFGRLRDLGVTRVYAVKSTTHASDLPLLVIPLPPGRKGDEIERATGSRVAHLFVESDGARREGHKDLISSQQVGPIVAIGRRSALDHLTFLRPEARPEPTKRPAEPAEIFREPEPRPDLLAGLAEAPADAPVVLVGGKLPSLGVVAANGAARLDDLNAKVAHFTASLRAADPGRVDLTVQATDPAAAATLADRLRDERIVGALVPQLAHVRPEVRGDRVVATADLSVGGMIPDLVAFLRLNQAIRDQNQSVLSLKMIGLALHNYEASNGAFPAAFTGDRQGRPLLSWRVAILPYLGGFPGTDFGELHEKFHLDEPYDSPHNRALIPLMPDVYASRRQSPDQVREGRTLFQVPRGVGTLFPGGRMVPTAELTDPSETTIALIEADPAPAVIWTKPQDWEVEARPIPPGRVGLVGFANGAVTPIRADLGGDLWRAATTRAGGEALAESALWSPPR